MDKYVANRVDGKAVKGNNDLPILVISSETLELFKQAGLRGLKVQSARPEIRKMNRHLAEEQFEKEIATMVDYAEKMGKEQCADYVEIYLIRRPLSSLGSRLQDGLMEEHEKVIAENFVIRGYLRERWKEHLEDWCNDTEFEALTTSICKDLAEFVKKDGNLFGGNWGNVYLDGSDLKLNIRPDEPHKLYEDTGEVELIME